MRGVSGSGKDVEYLLVTCEEFERDWWILAEEMSRFDRGWRVTGGI